MYRKVRTILTHPQFLRKKSAPFSVRAEWKQQDHEDIADLKDTFSVLQGYGLAAPQIGISKRVVIISLSALGLGEGDLVMINPEMQTSGDEQRNQESCFSVPHISAYVRRPLNCSIKFTTESGEQSTLDLSGFPAACLQHEIDHLDGKVYLDRIGSAWRSILKNKIRKIEKKKRADKLAAKEEFEREHLEIMGTAKKKTGHSRKRKPKARKKRPSRSKKR